MKVQIKAKDTTQAIIAQGNTREGNIRIFENNWYFSPDTVDMTHLVVTDRTYKCPYKGVANWLDYDSPTFSAKNVGWVYQEPLPTYNFTKGQIGFYGRDTGGTIIEQIDE